MIGSPLVIAEKARARLAAIVAGASLAPEGLERADLSPLPDPADLLITACEVNSLHGTGTLVQRIFADSRSIISLRCHNFYDGDQQFGAAQLCLPLAQSARTEIASWLKWSVANTTVRHILCLPYTPAEVNVALAAQDMLGAPLCTYIMDDKNVCADGISDHSMRELLTRSRLRLVISPEMRDAYERKYGMRFWVMPPVVAEMIVKRSVDSPAVERDPKRGILLGNIWGQRWLDALRRIFRDAEITVDWYCNQLNPPGLEYDRAELAADGIRQCEPIAEADLPAVIGKYAFAIVPTDSLDGKSAPAVRAIAELSLPSRMVTMMATAHVPMLVIGSRATCASAFVERFEIGTTVPYERAAVHAAIGDLVLPERQHAMRVRAAELSGYFTSARAEQWLWRSLETGAAITPVYEDLLPRTAAAQAVSAAQS